MDISLLFAQFMSGLARGMMLFLIASGLSLIFGVMNILNFAHATLWLAGAYFCYTFWHLMQDYGFGLWVSIALASLALAAVGWIIEVLLLRRVYDRKLPEQLLLTYGLILVVGDLIKLTWGWRTKSSLDPLWWRVPSSCSTYHSIPTLSLSSW
jgi:branched-subunit amino acid ABC-type transport system permease component